MIKTICSLSEAEPGKKNEDCVGYKIFSDNSSAMWVIDGGSSVADENYLDYENGDVHWFSKEISHAFNIYSHLDYSPTEILREAIQYVKSRYLEAVEDFSDIPKYAWPIAAITWIRLKEIHNFVEIEQIDLGDCLAFFDSKGEIFSIKNYNDNPQEVAIRQKVENIQKKNSNKSHDRKSALIKDLRARRVEQHNSNTPIIFGLNADNIDKIEVLHRSVPVDNFRGFMCTDGLFRLVDLYEEMSLKELFDFVFENGLETAISLLREIESGDPECIKYPRLKSSDDASGLLFQIKGS